MSSVSVWGGGKRLSRSLKREDFLFPYDVVEKGRKHKEVIQRRSQVTRWEVYPRNGVLHKCNCGKTLLGPHGFAVNKMIAMTNLINTGPDKSYRFTTKRHRFCSRCISFTTERQATAYTWLLRNQVKDKGLLRVL